MRLAALIVVLGVASGAAAQEPREPVRLSVEPLFGEGTLVVDGYAPVLVTLENVSGSDRRGELALRTQTFAEDSERHVAAVDLPRGGTRQIVMTPFADGNIGGVLAVYEEDGRERARGSADASYSGGARIVVVLGDPPRLRGALLDLDVSEQTISGPSQVRAPVVSVRLDASGDPVLPADVAGWSNVRLLVASAPVLARTTEAQRRVIADWLGTGGRLLVFPRSASDLDDPWLRELAGPVGAEPTQRTLPLVAPGVERFELSCSERQRVETFGCSAAVGFGRVYLAGYDGTTAAAIESGVPRELVRSVYEPWDEPPAHASPFGRGHDELTRIDYGEIPSFGALREALDPNEGFRPALVLVALVLLLYVIVVGPINFRWVQKKGRPALALITTPLAALACFALLLVVGYVGKGVTMRYRRFELVEAVEGQRRAPARRYTGLFATRPGSFDLPALAPGVAAHRVGGGGDSGPMHHLDGARVILRDFRAGLWETVFLREERVFDLEGSIRFVRDGRRLAEVVNETPRALSNAFVIHGSGALYVIGDIPAHGRAPIPRRAATTIPLSSYGLSDGHLLAEPIGIDVDDASYVAGLVGLTGRLAPVDVPILYARAPAERGALGAFEREHDERWLRVVPELPSTPVEPALPPTAPGEPPPMEEEDLAPADLADAGVDAAIEPAGPEVLP